MKRYRLRTRGFRRHDHGIVDGAIGGEGVEDERRGESGNLSRRDHRDANGESWVSAGAGRRPNLSFRVDAWNEILRAQVAV